MLTFKTRLVIMKH